MIFIMLNTNKATTKYFVSRSETRHFPWLVKHTEIKKGGVEMKDDALKSSEVAVELDSLRNKICQLHNC